MDRYGAQMRRALIPLLVLVAAVGLAAAGPSGAAKQQRPLVFAIVIDGLDGDKVDAGDTPFIESLLEGENANATYFEESRSVIIAETNPNHTAMVTGAYGERSGIPGNAFALYAPLENEDTCKRTGGFDFSQAPSTTSGEDSSCLQAETVFESIRRQDAAREVVTAGIFGKPKLGRIFAGRNVHDRQRDVHYLWAPCASGADDDDYCEDVPTNPVTGYAIDDKTVMDEVLRTVREGVQAAGRPHRQPDFTFVNLPQVDSAGHAFGTAGAYDAAITMADDQIERLVSELRDRGDWERTVLVLLSDHSMDTTVVKTNAQTLFDVAGIDDDEATIVQNGSIDAVYLNDRRSKDRFELLARMRAAALTSPTVLEALYREPNPQDGGRRHTIDSVHPGWHAAGRRSADLLLVGREGTAFSDPQPTSNPIPGNHGGPQTRDNFLAVIGGGGLVRQRTLEGDADELFDDTLENPDQAENVDVAPTVMRLFGLRPPRDNQGRFLRQAFDGKRLPAVRGRAGGKRR